MGPVEVYDAVVLAGGAARRLGGADKPGLTIGAETLLDRVLSAVPDARRSIVVGPSRATARPVVWTREQPPGGGPLPALAAGLAHVTAPTVLLLATDLPFLDYRTVGSLVSALEGPAEAAILVDNGGRDQPLLGAYRTSALRAGLGRCGPDLAGLPLRRVVAELALRRVPDRYGAAFDCDTWDDVERARGRALDTDRPGRPAV